MNAASIVAAEGGYIGGRASSGQQQGKYRGRRKKKKTDGGLARNEILPCLEEGSNVCMYVMGRKVC